METSAEECTLDGFVIKYINDISKTTIHEVKLVKNYYRYYYFEDLLLAKGEESVKNKIKEINKNKKIIKKNNDKNNNKNELKFYIIKVSINIFQISGISQDIYKKIELIDIPGLDKGYEEAIESGQNY